jgi:hypothetical protein
MVLAVIGAVEFAIMAAAKALRMCGVIQNDGMVKSLVSEAAVFNCGLIEVVTGKASVRKIQKQMHCTIVPQCSPRPGVRSIRTAVVLLTFVLVVLGEYAVFFIAQKTRSVGRISDGVDVITFDDIGAAAALDPRTDCALIDKKFTSEDSMTQYTYESCLLSLIQNAGSNRAINKELYFNFSTREHSNSNGEPGHGNIQDDSSGLCDNIRLSKSCCELQEGLEPDSGYAGESFRLHSAPKVSTGTWRSNPE